MTIREGEPIVFDTTGLTYAEVHRKPEDFLRRLMLLLTKRISGRTLDRFSNLLKKYMEQGSRIDVFLEREWGKVCSHCGHKQE